MLHVRARTFTFFSKVKNTTASAKKLKIVAKLESMYYNGHRKSGVKQTDKEQNLQPGEGEGRLIE